MNYQRNLKAEFIAKVRAHAQIIASGKWGARDLIVHARLRNELLQYNKPHEYGGMESLARWWNNHPAHADRTGRYDLQRAQADYLARATALLRSDFEETAAMDEAEALLKECTQLLIAGMRQRGEGAA